MLPSSRLALAFSTGIALLVACTTTPAAKDDGACTPNKPYFCRCRDRQEGQKICKPDKRTYGTCDPCETFDNPEIPLEPGDPGPEDPIFTVDAGGEDVITRPIDPNCPNGVVQAGEDCDDGDTNDTDGCDSSCKLAGTAPSKSNGCPGLDVHVWGGAHKPTLVLTTVGAGNRTANPTCSGASATVAANGSAAPDRVFKVYAHKTGTLTVSITDAAFDAFVYASDACNATLDTYLACANGTDGVGSETVSIPVVTNKSYYVFVDGTGAAATNSGTFRVTFAIP